MIYYIPRHILFIPISMALALILGLFLLSNLTVLANKDIQTQKEIQSNAIITYTRITTSTEPGRNSGFPSINSDGTKIVFESDSDLLNEGIGAFEFQIWLYDTTTMTYTRITTSTEPNRISYHPSINSDGTKIVFESDSDLLNEGIGVFEFQIWLYDTTTMTYTRITTSTEPSRISSYPSINGDGTKIVFESDSDLLNEGLEDDVFNVWLYDTTTMTYTRITTSTEGNRYSGSPSINDEGTRIAFESTSDLLNEGLGDEYNVWLYDTTTMTYTRITTSTGSGLSSYHSLINDEGTRIAFASASDLLNEGLENSTSNIWLYDIISMVYTRVTTSTEPNRDSYYPSINSDGTKITFQSDLDFLNEGLENNMYNIWLYDTVTMRYTRITTSTNEPSQSSYNSSINSDGTKIVLDSNVDLLNEGLSSNFHVWLSELSYIPAPSYNLYLPIAIRNDN